MPRAANVFEENCIDLWFVPGGGHSEYLFHTTDSLIKFSTIDYVSTKQPDEIVRLLDANVTRFGTAPFALKFDSDKAFNCQEVFEWCRDNGVEPRCVPPKAHWAAGIIERRQQVLKWQWKRLSGIGDCCLRPRTAF